MTIQKAPGPVAGAQSLQRASGLLSLLAQHQAQGLGMAELVALSGLDRTTVHRMLKALEALGLVMRSEDKRYGLGLQALALGLAAMQRSPLIARMTPTMKALARRCGAPVFLVVRAGDYSHCLHLEQGEAPIRSFADHVGATKLLGLGIPSFALLSALEDTRIHQHLSQHAREYAHWQLSEARLWRWVQQTRQQGYSHIHAQGLTGVGMRFALGDCADGALGIVAHAQRISRLRASALADQLAEALARV